VKIRENSKPKVSCCTHTLSSSYKTNNMDRERLSKVSSKVRNEGVF